MDVAEQSDLKAYADRLEFICRAQKAEIAKLREENERLRAAGGAHSFLKSVYWDEAAPQGNRIKAATAALPHETPKLMPERAPLDLQAEPELSLTELHERQLERLTRYSALTLEERSALITGVRRDGAMVKTATTISRQIALGKAGKS